MAQPQAKPLPQILQELWELLRDYAKQETIDPLRQLGRYLGFGVGGSLLIAFGSILMGLATLRFLQTQTGDFFLGWRSVLPYVIVLFELALVAGASVVAAQRHSRD